MHTCLDLPQQFAGDNYSGICPEAWAANSDLQRIDELCRDLGQCAEQAAG